MIEVRNVHIKYGKRQVIDGVSFSVAAGRVTCLLGSNGIGKTTLLRSLNGSVGLDQGEILIDGKDIRSYSRREIARQIAVVAQENETRFPIRVVEFVLAGRFSNSGPFGLESFEDEQTADSAIKKCGLDGMEDRDMSELSGGERQRAVMARALATDAEIFLLDEPTANIDIEHQLMIFRLIREMCNEKGKAAVIITHDLNFAAAFADECILLDDGRIFASGRPGEVLTADNIKSVFKVDVDIDTDKRGAMLIVPRFYN